MERTKALAALQDAADLCKMVEEMMAPGMAERLPSTQAGIRVAIRNVRESIVTARDSLARDLVAAARAARAEPSVNTASAAVEEDVELRRPEVMAPAQKPISHDALFSSGTRVLGRNDLRSTVEKLVEK